MNKINRKILSFLDILIIILIFITMTSCRSLDRRHEKVYFEYFDTVSYIYSYANDTEKEFNKNCDDISKILEEYHQLCDIYYEYHGINNLCTINKNAGGSPIKVDKKLIDFLLYCKNIYTYTNGETNIMMGAITKLWHDERINAIDNPDNAKVPSKELLEEKNLYTDIDLLEIDEENSTVRIKNKNASIDVGAIAKGYATEKAASYLEENNQTNYVLVIGGNIKVIGSKANGEGLKTGIKDPRDKTKFAFFTELKNTSCVTSGNYERYYTVDNQNYHHIIDKDTLMPADYFASITIITKDSALADALSTALFCMPYQEGYELVLSLQNVDCIWIYNDGTIKRISIKTYKLNA